MAFLTMCLKGGPTNLSFPRKSPLQLSREAKFSIGTGGPLKPAFGLSGGAVLQLDKVFPPLVRVFVLSIPTRTLRVPQRRLRSGENCSTQTQGPFDFAQGRLSTPQIIAFAMICSGRDDRIGRSEHPHSSQNQA